MVKLARRLAIYRCFKVINAIFIRPAKMAAGAEEYGLPGHRAAGNGGVG
jgi:hypothetical protein